MVCVFNKYNNMINLMINLIMINLIENTTNCVLSLIFEAICCHGICFLCSLLLNFTLNLRPEWMLPLRGRITYRHCRQQKLLNFLYSSNHLFGGGAVNVGNAIPTFCFSVSAISMLTTLTVESSWTAPTETLKHLIMANDEAS